MTDNAKNPHGTYLAGLCDWMRFEGSMFDHKIKSWSGADQADSELHRLARLVYVDLHEGKNLETSLTARGAEWAAYAKNQAAKVAAASKIKRGPSAGHSVISHRWVSPEAWTSKAADIRRVVEALQKKCFGYRAI